MPLASGITLQIPGMLRADAAGASRLPVEGATLREALARLEPRLPALHRSILDETGAVRRHVNLFINADNIKVLQGLDSPLAPGDVVTVVPAVSGG